MKELQMQVPPGLRLRETLRHDVAFGRIAWSPDGRLLAAPSYAGTIVLWDPFTKELTTLRHGPAVVSSAWSPDGKVLASGGHDGTIRLWDLRSHQQLLTLENGSRV